MSAQLLAYQCPHCGKMMEVEPTAGDAVLTCPNPECQKPFRLDVPRAQPAPALIVPAEAQERPAELEAALVAQTGPATEPELATVRPEMFRRYPLRCLLLAALAVGGIAGIMYALWAQWPLLALAAAACAAYGVIRLALWWLRNRHTTLTVTTRRSVLRTGVLRTQDVEIPHAEVREVHVSQSWRDRMLNVGDLVILGAENHGAGIQVFGVARAQEIAALIRGRRQS